MKHVSRRVALVALAALIAGPPIAAAQPLELRNGLNAARLRGKTRFTAWGFNIYDASLWVEAGFDPDEYERHAFALELTYLRDFSNQAIAERSINEMRRLSRATQEQLTAWQQSLRLAFPDIRKGDRITGIHRPGVGALFITNGQPSGAVRDAEFARLFFGIWLSAQTSEPGLRAALVSGATTQ